MGWAERLGYRGPRQHGGIVRANGGDRHVHISEMSKTQIARALNEQGERFKVLRQHLETATRALAAIALAPDALQYRDGYPCIEATALDQVKDGMTIHMEPVGDVLRLRVVRPEQADVVVPNIVVPH